jgi:hypothetical protein
VKKKSIEEALGHEDYQRFLSVTDTLYFAVEENYSAESVKVLFDNVCSFKKKLEEVLK